MADCGPGGQRLPWWFSSCRDALANEARAAGHFPTVCGAELPSPAPSVFWDHPGRLFEIQKLLKGFKWLFRSEEVTAGWLHVRLYLGT